MLMCAARHGQLDIMKLLVESGAEVDAVNEVIATFLKSESSDYLCGTTDVMCFRHYRLAALL